jgi:hypothetical protein
MPTRHCPVPVLSRSAKTSFPGRGPLRYAPWSFSPGRQKLAGPVFRPASAVPAPTLEWSRLGVVTVFCALASAGPPAVSVALPVAVLCRLLWPLVLGSRCRPPGVCWRVPWLFCSPSARSASTHEKDRTSATRATGTLTGDNWEHPEIVVDAGQHPS